MKHSDNDIKTIKEGIISNTVKIGEESRQSSERFTFMSKKLIDNNDRMEKLMESNVELQNDFRAVKDELASIKNLHKFIQSENVQKPPASGQEDSSTKQNICIKENLSSVTNNEIRDSEVINYSQSNNIIPALTVQDKKVTSLINNISMDVSTQPKESYIPTIRPKSTKKIGGKRFST